MVHSAVATFLRRGIRQSQRQQWWRSQRLEQTGVGADVGGAGTGPGSGESRAGGTTMAAAAAAVSVSAGGAEAAAGDARQLVRGSRALAASAPRPAAVDEGGRLASSQFAERQQQDIEARQARDIAALEHRIAWRLATPPSPLMRSFLMER